MQHRDTCWEREAKHGETVSVTAVFGVIGFLRCEKLEEETQPCVNEDRYHQGVLLMKKYFHVMVKISKTNIQQNTRPITNLYRYVS